MHDLIYFPLPILSEYDQFLKLPKYAHYRWFELINTLEWPSHTVSRVHTLDTPWSLAGTVCPIPEINHSEQNFNRVIESIAENCVRHVRQSGRQPYVLWSGGIDSTTILVSLLRVADKDFLDQLIVLHDEMSIMENPYFYSRWIQGRLQTQNLNEFVVSDQNFDKIILLDGEGGNQCTGWRSINALAYANQYDLLDSNWRRLSDLTKLLPGSTTFTIDLIRDSIDHAPVDIVTGYDFIWWANFNFKFDEVLLRKIVSYTQHLTPEQCGIFWNTSLYRFYAQPEMQVWSMISTDLRREKTHIVSKYFSKKYIYDFDQNELWFANKREEGSFSCYFSNSATTVLNPVIAIDQNWKKYSICDPSTRLALGDILGRNSS